LKVQGSRFKVQGSRFKVQGSRFKVQGSNWLYFARYFEFIKCAAFLNPALFLQKTPFRLLGKKHFAKQKNKNEVFPLCLRALVAIFIFCKKIF
jgi:hypothetical protein